MITLFVLGVLLAIVVLVFAGVGIALLDPIIAILTIALIVKIFRMIFKKKKK